MRILLALALLLPSAALADTAANGSHMTNMACVVYFSPNGGAQQVIVSAIGASARTIRVAAYEITVKAIADALIAAHARGVDVRIIVDRSESRQAYSQVQYLANAGLDVAYDPAVAIHHNKFMVIDGYTLLTGSYNYSSAAEFTNAENMLACHSTGGAAVYTAYWNDVRPRMVQILPAAGARR